MFSVRLGGLADQAQRLRLPEWVDLGRFRIRDQDHIPGLDGLEADAGTIEGYALRKGLLFKEAGWNGQVVPLADKVDELQVDHLHMVILDGPDQGFQLFTHFPFTSQEWFVLTQRGPTT